MTPRRALISFIWAPPSWPHQTLISFPKVPLLIPSHLGVEFQHEFWGDAVHNKGPLVTLAKLYLCTAAVLGTGLHRWTQVWGSDKLPWKLITHHPKEIPTWDLDFPGCFAAAPEGLRLVWPELEPAYTNWQYRCSGSPGAQVVSGWAFPLCGASQNETNWNKSVLKQSIENTQIDMCEFDSNSTIC